MKTTHFSLLLKFKVESFSQERNHRGSLGNKHVVALQSGCVGESERGDGGQTFQRRRAKVRSLQDVLQKHSKRLTHSPWTHGWTVMNIVLHLNMKNPLWWHILWVWTSMFLVLISASCEDGTFGSLYISLMCLWFSVFFPFMSCSNKLTLKIKLSTDHWWFFMLLLVAVKHLSKHLQADMNMVYLSTSVDGIHLQRSSR